MKKPKTKVAAGGVAGCLSIIVVWLLGQLGVEVPAEVAAAIATLIAVAVAPRHTGETT